MIDVKTFFERFGKYCSKIPRLSEQGKPKCLDCKYRNFCYSPPDQLENNVENLDEIFNSFEDEQ